MSGVSSFKQSPIQKDVRPLTIQNIQTPPQALTGKTSQPTTAAKGQQMSLQPVWNVGADILRPSGQAVDQGKQKGKQGPKTSPGQGGQVGQSGGMGVQKGIMKGEEVQKEAMKAHGVQKGAWKGDRNVSAQDKDGEKEHSAETNNLLQALDGGQATEVEPEARVPANMNEVMSKGIDTLMMQSSMLIEMGVPVADSLEVQASLASIPQLEESK